MSAPNEAESVFDWSSTSEESAHPPVYTVSKQPRNNFKYCTERDLAKDASVKITY